MPRFEIRRFRIQHNRTAVQKLRLATLWYVCVRHFTIHICFLILIQTRSYEVLPFHSTHRSIGLTTTTMSTPSASRYRRPAGPATDTTTPSIPPQISPAAKEKAELKAAVKEQAVETSNGLSLLDILRILGGLLVLSAGLSWLTTSQTSLTWGYNPWWTRAREWKALMVRPCPYLLC